MLTLRPFQKEAIQALKSSTAHVLCVAPTGSGKSLIYENRISTGKFRTLLVSPLVALARQQRERIREKSGAHHVVRLGSGQPSEGPPERGPGTWIVSPETLVHSQKRTALLHWHPDFLVVDECHCLWEWGENFRPAFAEIPKLIARHQIPRSLWLTATLPLGARKELRRELPSPLREIGEFNLPPSLELTVQRVPWVERISTLMDWVRARKGAGVIFTGTRDGTERICRVLEAMGIAAVAYHAGRSQEERRAIEKMITERIPKVIVATSAFGMGMDHPHLTWVALLQPPGSLLSLTQAIGRAGRAPSGSAQALVLWDNDDFRLLEWTLGDSVRRKEELMELTRFLLSQKCRRAALKEYFEGSDGAGNQCERCDRCRQ